MRVSGAPVWWEPSSPPSSALVNLCSEALIGPQTSCGEFPVLAPLKGKGSVFGSGDPQGGF